MSEIVIAYWVVASVTATALYGLFVGSGCFHDRGRFNWPEGVLFLFWVYIFAAVWPVLVVLVVGGGFYWCLNRLDSYLKRVRITVESK